MQMPTRLQKYLQKKKNVFDTNPSSSHSYSLTIVYFANLFVNPIYGSQLIREQLRDLSHTAIMCPLHIVLSVPLSWDKTLLEDLRNILYMFTIFFHIEHEDCFEYPGIRKVYSLATTNPSSSHYILYFHSKSMSRYQGVREDFEQTLHSTVIVPWKKVLAIFYSHPTIDKIGWSASGFGFIWYNYWWARASYLSTIESPVKTPRRHYYEDWLCRVLLDQTQHEIDPLRPEKCFQPFLYRHQDSNCWSLSFPNNPIGHGIDMIPIPPELSFN